jgi:hypothetical protein
MIYEEKMNKINSIAFFLVLMTFTGCIPTNELAHRFAGTYDGFNANGSCQITVIPRLSWGGGHTRVTIDETNTTLPTLRNRIGEILIPGSLSEATTVATLNILDETTNLFRKVDFPGVPSRQAENEDITSGRLIRTYSFRDVAEVDIEVIEASPHNHYKLVAIRLLTQDFQCSDLVRNDEESENYGMPLRFIHNSTL